MYLSAILKRNELTMKIADYQQQLTDIEEQLSDLQSYAGCIADGGVTIGELMNTPTSMYNRYITFMNTSQAYSQMTAGNQLQQLIGSSQYQQLMMQQSGGNPQIELWYRNAAYQKFFEQAQSSFVRYEKNLLHQKEKTLMQRKNALQGTIASYQEQQKRYEQEIQNGRQELFSAKA